MSGDISKNLGGPSNFCSPSPCILRPFCPYFPSPSPPSSPLSNTRLPFCSPLHSSSPPPRSFSLVAPSIKFCSPSPVGTSGDDCTGRSCERGRRDSHDRSPSLAIRASLNEGRGRGR